MKFCVVRIWKLWESIIMLSHLIDPEVSILQISESNLLGRERLMDPNRRPEGFSKTNGSASLVDSGNKIIVFRSRDKKQRRRYPSTCFFVTKKQANECFLRADKNTKT